MKKYSFYSFGAAMMLFALIPFLFLESYEFGFAIGKVFDGVVFFALLSVVLSIVFREQIFSPLRLKSKWMRYAVTVLQTIAGAVAMFLFISGLVSGLLLTVNSYMGAQQTINVNTKGLSTHKTVSKYGNEHYYITIKLPQEKRNIDLKVQRPHQTGEIFEGKLRKGSLNMYYK